VRPCSWKLHSYQQFGATYSLHLQDKRIIYHENRSNTCACNDLFIYQIDGFTFQKIVPLYLPHLSHMSTLSLNNLCLQSFWASLCPGYWQQCDEKSHVPFLKRNEAQAYVRIVYFFLCIICSSVLWRALTFCSHQSCRQMSIKRETNFCWEICGRLFVLSSGV
jgi:hypothetical protein